MRIALPASLSLSLLLFAPLAVAQVRVDAPVWAPDGGSVPVMPGDSIGRTPNAERIARPGRARSHLYPGDAQRRQDERDLADEAAMQQSLDAETARSIQRTQREILNQQYSDQIRSQMLERDRSVLELQLSQPRPIYAPPPNLLPPR